jgi:voltage-gated potassium channel Kch
MIRINARPRVRILGGVVVAIFAHSIEVMIFALGYFFADRLGHGELTGAFSGTMADYIYFSYATFTTVGYGDIVATDRVRMLVGVESLTGFVLITWTASFLYLEMSRFWSNR